MNKSNIVYSILGVVTLILFYLAFNFEKAGFSRSLIILILFGVQIILFIIRSVFNKNIRVYFISMCLSLVVVLLLENQSRYIVNYFFHFMYILIILEATYYLSFKYGVLISILAMMFSVVKYIYWIYIDFSTKTAIEGVFSFLLIGLITVIAAFGNYYFEGKKKTENLYSELLLAHDKLKESTNQIKELTVIKERNRIARDLHDTLGHSMTGLIMELELTNNYINQDKIQEGRELLGKAKEHARETLRQIRMAVDTLKENEQNFDGINSIKQLIMKFGEQTGVRIYLNVINNGKNVDMDNFEQKNDNNYGIIIHPDMAVVFYRTIQEAITNSVKHGNASRVDVGLNINKDRIVLSIQDNGKGCEKIIENNGLKSMKERVANIGGEIEVQSSNKGFIVKVRVVK